MTQNDLEFLWGHGIIQSFNFVLTFVAWFGLDNPVYYLIFARIHSRSGL
jgi:hypothetical protein